jgi:hypothetical protein
LQVDYQKQFVLHQVEAENRAGVVDYPVAALSLVEEVDYQAVEVDYQEEAEGE